VSKPEQKRLEDVPVVVLWPSEPFFCSIEVDEDD
jgi:hypothetical protein